jgi:nickel-dependent lactate racemase
MPILDLGYGESILHFKVSQRNLRGVINPNHVENPSDEDHEIRSALSNPMDTARPSELVSKGDRVAIIASDITRPSPTSKLLPPLIGELAAGGVNLGDVRVLFALGAHRKHSREEVRRLVGENIFSQVSCDDHRIDNCVDIGRTRHGTRVEVLKDILEYDIVICTGNIEPHYMAGYSGGLKAILPGVCSRNTIEQNHRMMTQPGSRAGNIDGNPVREDIDDVSKLVEVDLIVNAILDDRRRIVKVVAGDPIAAHRKGAQYSDTIYKVKVPEPADIVIASPGGYPRDINLYQAQKALENARQATRPGGIIILVAQCMEGSGDSLFQEWLSGASSPDEVLNRISKKFVLGGHKAAAFASVMHEHQVYLVSSMPAELVNRMHFKAAPTVEKALDEALHALGKDTRVLVLPDGNSTLPDIEAHTPRDKS